MTWRVPQATAYGGILLNAEGQVLLREPLNHFDGYTWTFAKGRPEPDEEPMQTALREVLEETGYEAKVLDVLPGLFAGSTTTNAYFIMVPAGEQGSPANETASTRWVSFDAAENLIQLTTNKTGRKRDLAILAAARSWHERCGAAYFDGPPSDDPFVDALLLATQPNYLGNPEVVHNLMVDWFVVVLDCLQSKATAQQRHAKLLELTRIMSEDHTGYVRMPGWHTSEQLGKVLVTACNLDAEYCADENLAFIVSEALAGISIKIGNLANLFQNKKIDEAELQSRLEEMLSFTVAAFLGTHTLLFPDKNLSSFLPQEESSPSFSELLRKLNAVSSRKPPLNLDELGIPPGTVLTFKAAPHLQAVVARKNRVEFMGELLSLSKAAVKAFQQLGSERKAARGPDYWCHKGMTLTKYRQEVEGSHPFKK